MSLTATTQRRFAGRLRLASFLDVAIAAAPLVVSLALLSHHGGLGAARPGPRDLDPIGVLVAACSTLPLVAWRRSPLGVFALTATAGALLAGLGYRIDFLLGPSVALYVLAASRSEDNRWTPHSIVTVFGLFVAYLAASAAAQGTFPGPELLHTGLAWGVAWFAGERTRLRREHIAELQERALRAEREAEGERRLAVAEERARIARDLHDSAGHAINVIVVRAGAARMRHDEDSERSRAALETIEEVARQTAAEIDHIVGALRDRRCPNGTVDAPPGLASLDTLVAHHAATGLDVTVDTVGAPRALSVPVDQAAYRILQEALTNASRHGAGTASVELAFGETALELTVANPVLPNGTTGPNGGHGLIGMRERATLVGGSLQEARANGAFCVHAHLPYTVGRHP